ncbi:MAG TPA: ATP-binding protein [Bryobacteraceae bacterium]|nr:ATP-binding protein [Bryobacteraceae bacterium]
MKLAVCVVASFTAFVALFSYLGFREHRRHSEDLVVTSADRLTDVIQRSTSYQMLHNDRAALYQMIHAIGSEPGIRRVRIFNEDGRISFSTSETEVGTVLDKQAEACYACHAQAAPLTKLDRPDRARIFPEENAKRVLGIIRPIENQPACSNAACHAHPPQRRILGVTDVQISLESVDAQLAEYRRHLLAITGLSVLLGSLVSVGFILLFVHRPVGELIAGTQTVAGGNLGHRLPVRSGDELGELAESFNKMTEDLERAHLEITTWARTLEERVEKKSAELQRVHESLLTSEKMASLGKLAATVAHEVNNPLFGILTYARLSLRALEKSDLSPESKAQVLDQLRTIERESRRCGEIMKNLLNFARQVPPHREAHDLNVLVDRAITLVRHQLALQEIELEKRLQGDLPACFCDADQIQQVVLALLINASDVMPGGGTIRVTTESVKSGENACIRVADTGGGIDSETLPKIFEPFFTTKEDQHRTGLGLAIAKGIVERHGGFITVISKPGEGTEFTILLPVGEPIAAGPDGKGNRN